MQRRTATLSVGAIAGLILSAVLALPAHASTDQPTPDPSAPAAPDISVQYLPYEAPDIQPAPGQSVTVTDVPGEVTTYYGVTLACTESVTAYTPYKSGSSAIASVQFSRSSGCSGGKQANAYLQTEQGVIPTWQDRDDSHTTVNPGTTLSLTVSRGCTNSNTTKWRSLGFYGNATGVPTISGVAYLSCGG